jgi:phosphorylcholine metabolism protein LicD
MNYNYFNKQYFNKTSWFEFKKVGFNSKFFSIMLDHMEWIQMFYI